MALSKLWSGSLKCLLRVHEPTKKTWTHFLRPCTWYQFCIPNCGLSMQQFGLEIWVQTQYLWMQTLVKITCWTFTVKHSTCFMTTSVFMAFFVRLLVNGQFWACGQGTNLNAAQILHLLMLPLIMDFYGTQLQESWCSLQVQSQNLKPEEGILCKNHLRKMV